MRAARGPSSTGAADRGGGPDGQGDSPPLKATGRARCGPPFRRPRGRHAQVGAEGFVERADDQEALDAARGRNPRRAIYRRRSEKQLVAECRWPLELSGSSPSPSASAGRSCVTKVPRLAMAAKGVRNSVAMQSVLGPPASGTTALLQSLARPCSHRPRKERFHLSCSRLLNRNPWNTPATNSDPTMSPRELIAAARVTVEPGRSMVLNCPFLSR